MQENLKTPKVKQTAVLMFSLVAIVMMSIMGTYAYFIINVNNENRQNAQIDTGTMRLTFADGNPTINERIMLGETKTKTFTLENTGDLDAVVSIDWLDLVNTYMEGSLTYTLEQSETEGSGYTEIIGKTNVPVTSAAFTTTLAPDITVPVGKKYYYNLIITFNDLADVDQEADRKANLSTKFTVSQPSTNRNYDLIIDPNGGTLGDSNTVQTLTKKNGETETIGTPTKIGATFKGWIVVGYGSILEENALIMGKANTKLVAEYTEFNAVKAVNDILNNKLPEGVIRESPDFAATTVANEAKVYSMEDDYGTSYFYRGAVTNNYVKFADLYWRIIRINGEGSVRIQYDGTSAHANGENATDRFAFTNQAYNANYNDAKYVGWMYGPAGTEASISKEEAQTNTASSDIKKVVDSWYKTNIVDAGYSRSVADTIFCNDRSTSDIPKQWWDIESSKPGYGLNNTAYGSFQRFVTINGVYNQTNPQPTFKCSNKNDAFTVSQENLGNGDLDYPVGLITADEVVAAGNIPGKNNIENYLYNPKAWSWTMSPCNFNNKANVFFNFMNGYGSAYVDITDGSINPVINLTPEYFKTLIGTGTMENPFRAENVEP